MTNPVYPQAIIPWTDREDEVDVVWAADPNSLAADLAAVETTLGVMPQVMDNPPAGGPPVTFNNVGQYLDYLSAGYQMPVCEVQNADRLAIGSRQGPGTYYGVRNAHSQVVYDPFGMWNGTDVTVAQTGWYSVYTSQLWDWHDIGYCAHHLFVGTDWKDCKRWDWQFNGNTFGGPWQGYAEVQRPVPTSIFWEGVINAGTRISAYSENGTNLPLFYARNFQLSVAMKRLTPPDLRLGPQPAGAPATFPPPQVSRWGAPANLLCVNQGFGSIQVGWDRITYPQPPGRYIVAVYYGSPGGGIASYTTVITPLSAGRHEVVIANLPLGQAYQVAVWADGSLLTSPFSSHIISI